MNINKLMETEEDFKSIRGFEPISSDQMYQIENIGESEFSMKKILMMENAGSRIADFLINEFGDGIVNKSIIAVCGKGNNGGDALVAMRHLSGYILSKTLSENTPELTIVLLCNPNDLKTSEAISNWEIIKKIGSVKTYTLESCSLEEIEEAITKSDIILDGIFGTGIKGEINEPYSGIIQFINTRKNNSYILSVDIPSGLNPDTGKINDKAIIADTTLTFHRPKHGHLNGATAVGKLIVKKIGIPYEAEKGVVKNN
jgi:NAD(P)H-hydrate epimerase